MMFNSSTNRIYITREMVEDNLVSVRCEGDSMVIYVRGQIAIKLESQVIKLIESTLQTSHETTTKASDNDLYEECELKSW